LDHGRVFTDDQAINKPRPAAWIDRSLKEWVMRKVHQSGALQMLAATPRQLRLPGALRLQAGCAGWLWADSGAVWITREGESVDHVLSTAEALYLGQGDQVVVEPWQAGRAAGLRWAQASDTQALADLEALRRAEGAAPLRPARSSGVFVSGAAASGWPWADAAWRVLAAGLAAGLRGLAGRLAAAARSADAMASRAQGCMAAGESRASSGALQ
jgi:hypothetical protein